MMTVRIQTLTSIYVRIVLGQKKSLDEARVFLTMLRVVFLSEYLQADPAATVETDLRRHHHRIHS